jgi:hypothetical protein
MLPSWRWALDDTIVRSEDLARISPRARRYGLSFDPVLDLSGWWYWLWVVPWKCPSGQVWDQYLSWNPFGDLHGDPWQYPWVQGSGTLFEAQHVHQFFSSGLLRVLVGLVSLDLAHAGESLIDDSRGHQCNEKTSLLA